MIKTFKKIIGTKTILLFVLGFSIMIGLEFLFLNRELVIGNLGKIFYCTELGLVIINSILFGFFLSLSFYRLEYFSAKKSSIGILGGFFGIVVSGCPVCSITLASYMGLAGIISTFPYSGLELKFVSLFLLLYANYSTLKNLETCKIKNKGE